MCPNRGARFSLLCSWLSILGPSYGNPVPVFLLFLILDEIGRPHMGILVDDHLPLSCPFMCMSRQQPDYTWLALIVEKSPSLPSPMLVKLLVLTQALRACLGSSCPPPGPGPAVFICGALSAKAISGPTVIQCSAKESPQNFQSLLRQHLVLQVHLEQVFANTHYVWKSLVLKVFLEAISTAHIQRGYKQWVFGQLGYSLPHFLCTGAKLSKLLLKADG